MSIVCYKGSKYTLRAGETVLDGLLRHGCDVTYSCRSGSCHSCLLRAVSGKPPEVASRGVDQFLRASGYFLPCKCVPDTPLFLEDPDPKHLRIRAQVADKQILSCDLCRILLEPARNLNALPGQHITVVDRQGQARPYSLAGLPDEDYYLELNVRRVSGGAVSSWLYHQLRVGDEIAIQPPSGNLVNRNPPPSQTLILLATGTGLAPMLAILRDALRRDDYAQVVLFHGGRTIADLYADGMLRRMASENARLAYFSCLSRPAARAPWLSGRITRHFPGILAGTSDADVFIAGHPEMVRDARALCLEHGIAEAGRIRTDAFSYSHVAGESVTSPTERIVPPPDPELWNALQQGKLLMDVLREFYAIVFKDERLAPYFSDVTRQRLVEKQFSFLRSLITGSRDYLGQRPRNAHHWMVISDDLFDYRLSIMQKCLERHGLESIWVQRWHVYEEFFRADIVKDRPAPRIVDGQIINIEGFEEIDLDEATLCDGCQGEIPTGVRIRYHRRLGKVYCRECAPMSSDRELSSMPAA